MRVNNGIPLGCLLALTDTIVIFIQTLKVLLEAGDALYILT
jgi:hypothetical protein